MKLTKEQLSWVLYDPACAAHALIVRTLFAALFLKYCADGQTDASSVTGMWAATASFACLAAGVISVLAGPRADAASRKKTVLCIAAAVCIISCFAYWFCGKGDWKWVLAISFTGIASFAVANSFYDSLLPGIAPPQQRDMLSSLSFAAGYGGSTVTALICLPVIFLVGGELSLRLSFIIAGVWFALLALPLVFNVKEKAAVPAHSPKRLPETFSFILKEKNILIFLIAYLLYIDIVGTILFAAAPLAAGLQISEKWLLTTILGLQLIGLPFTLLYGHLAQKTSSGKLLNIAIIIYMIIAALAAVMSAVESIKVRQIIFVLIAFLAGTSQGGIQSLSRSFFTSLIPEERSAELFSVYNIFGRFTTVIGPLLMIPIAVWVWDKAELGITLMIIPAAAGLFLLNKVRSSTEKQR